MFWAGSQQILMTLEVFSNLDGIPTHGCWMGLRGPGTPQPLCSLLPLPSLIQTSPDPSGPASDGFSLLNPGKTNSAQTRAVPGGKRNLGCHRVPTNPQRYPVRRGQGPSSRRNSIVHKGNHKIRPGTLFLLAGMEGATLLALPEHSGGNPALVNRLAADPKAGSVSPGLLWQLPKAPAPPHTPEASSQAAAKGAASPTAATMQQLTGPGVKGNVRASARNIKISDKGAIVAPELLNSTWIHEPLSFTNRPGALQHPWVQRERKRSPGTVL